MSTTAPITRISTRAIKNRKGGQPIVCLTSYTSTIARHADKIADLILIGDSVGMVLHGMKNTIPVVIDQMIPNARAVMNASERACVIMDMPFGSYEESKEVAYRNAVRIMKETGVSGVKMEGGKRLAETVTFLVERGIPVMGHIGMLPQMVAVRGGFQAVGRTGDDWDEHIADALALADAGAFSIVLAGMAEPLAAHITEKVPVPTIGIGASARCDGQILVTEDMLGLMERVPPFVKRYGAIADEIARAMEAYAHDVRARAFPAPEHTYSMKD